MGNKKLSVILLSTILLIFTGCAAYYLDDAQIELRNSFAQGNYTQASGIIERLEQDNIYKEKDYVLLYLEKASILHFSGDYQNSNRLLTNAEEEIEAQFARSVTRAIQSFIVNDNSLVYGGEDYEDIYINAFKSLNYIHLGDLEAALIEARRMSFKMDRLDAHYRGLAESLAKADTTGQAEWKVGETNIENSAMGHYLASILYAKSNRPDNARIELERAQIAITDQKAMGSSANIDYDLIEKIQNPRSYNVLLKSFAGRPPLKEQNDIRIYLEEKDFYLKFSFPTLKMHNSPVYNVNAIINDTLNVPLYLIEEMDIIAKEVYKIKEPLIYAKAFVRAFLKAFGTQAISNRIGEENETLGEIFNLLGKIGQEVTEKADLRNWQTMPGKAYSNLVLLPPGQHRIRVEYLNSNGTLLYFEEQNVDVSPNNPIALVQTLYWN